MSPVSPSTSTKLPTPMVSSGGATPFVLAGKADGQASKPLERDPMAGPDCAMPVDDAPVPAADLLAALDRSARTSIVPNSASTDNDTTGSTKDDAADPAAQGALPQPVIAPVVQVPGTVNPFIAMLAATPVVAQAMAPTDSKTDDSIQVAKPTDPKAAATATVTGKPEPSVIAPFIVPAELTKTAERTRNEAIADTTVALLTDTGSDTGAAPTMSAPVTATHNQSMSALNPQVAAPTDAMINRQLDLARGDAWLDTLARDIAAIAGSGDRLRFGLSPEHLGKLEVEVSRHDAGVAIHMTTRSEEARSIIAAAQPRLVDELRANGTRVVAADVTSQMNAQTDGRSSGFRPQYAPVVEAAIDFGTPVASNSTDTTKTASGRYA